jgi:exopolysaccharide biosynthesis polyprenyl glycosylphosphotransferase
MQSRSSSWWNSASFAVGVAGARPSSVADTFTPGVAPPGPDWPRSNGAEPAEEAVGRRGYKGWGRWFQSAYALIDIVCVVINALLAFYLKFAPADLWSVLTTGRLRVPEYVPVAPYCGFLLLYVALILLFCQGQNLYSTPRARTASQESRAVVNAVFFATLLLTAFIYLSGVKVVSRLIVAMASLLNVGALVAWRYAKHHIVLRRVEQGIGARNVLIVGAGRVGQALARELDSNKLLGYRFKGFLDGNHCGDPRLLGKIEDLSRVARAEFIDEVFITIPSERELVKQIFVEARYQRLDVNVVPDLYDGLGWRAPVRQLGDFPVMELHWQPIPALGLFAKRLLDLTVGSIAMIVSLPIMAIAAIWIRLDSQGPALYRSWRVGQKGRTFAFFKLRTMVLNAHTLKESLRDRNERDGPCFKIGDDPRVTRPGKFLRKYSVDELPQLWNVLRGDMTLVGPRPHSLEDYELYDIDHLRRLDVRPGITGYWQVAARQDPSFETNMRLDMEYIEHWNLKLDLQILVRTVLVVLKGTGR